MLKQLNPRTVRDRALGDAQGGGDSGVGQPTFVLETENFSNSSHGNPVGWHRRLPVQKGASVAGRRFELHAPQRRHRHHDPDFRASCRQSDQLHRRCRHGRKSGQHPSDSPVNIRMIHRSTSSDSAVIIRRKPRSRSVGIHIETLETPLMLADELRRNGPGRVARYL